MVFILAFRSCFLPVWLNVLENDMEYESHRPFWNFFDLKAYLIMACMMGSGIGFRALGIFPDIFVAFFYSGLCSGIGRRSFYKKLFLLQQIDK